MKVDVRVAATTTTALAIVLFGTSLSLARRRTALLEEAYGVRAAQMADALTTGIGPLADLDAPRVLEERVEAARGGTAPGFGIEIVAIGARRPSNLWSRIAEEAARAGAPRGRLFQTEGLPSVFMMAIPIHSAAREDSSREIVAMLGLVLDAKELETSTAAFFVQSLPVVALATCVLGVLIFLSLRSSVVGPLRNLIEAIDGVAKGDLSRAILPQSEDEIGKLAGRFNAMTQYLRTAREEERLANEARLQLEARLHHSEKLATMGQLAAEIAHEVGTPLGVIGGRASSIARRPSDPEEARRNAEIIGVQVDRITKIIRRALDFSRKSLPEKKKVVLAELVTETLELVASTLATHNVIPRTQLDEGLPQIVGDPEELQQVVLNLLNNALYAMPEGGELGVLLAKVVRRREGLALSAPSAFVMLEITDSGKGIPRELREQIFEPFFTTKDVGEGTGLGLAVCKGILKDHDGWIEVDEAQGGGAVFRVFLPEA